MAPPTLKPLAAGQWKPVSSGPGNPLKCARDYGALEEVHLERVAIPGKPGEQLYRGAATDGSALGVFQARLVPGTNADGEPVQKVAELDVYRLEAPALSLAYAQSSVFEQLPSLVANNPSVLKNHATGAEPGNLGWMVEKIEERANDKTGTVCSTGYALVEELANEDKPGPDWW